MQMSEDTFYNNIFYHFAMHLLKSQRQEVVDRLLTGNSVLAILHAYQLWKLVCTRPAPLCFWSICIWTSLGEYH